MSQPPPPPPDPSGQPPAPPPPPPGYGYPPPPPGYAPPAAPGPPAGWAPAPPPAPSASGRRLVGLALLAPPLIALLVGYVWPTISTVVDSFHAYSLVGEREPVGTDNYRRMVEEPIGFGLPMALSFALLPLLVLLVVAPLLAWAAHAAGRPMRLATRLALTLPMVCFAPAAMAVGWLVTRESRFPLADLPERLADPDVAPSSLRMMLWLSMIGLICGVGVTLFLAALRGRRPGGSAWPAGLTVGAIAALATVAIAVQAFTYPYVVTGGGPADATSTPMLATFLSGLQRFDLGYGATYAVVTLSGLMALGVLAWLLATLTGLRIELEPRTAPAPARAGTPAAPDPPAAGPAGTRLPALLAAAAGLLVVLVVTGYGLWPWLSRLGSIGDGAPVGNLLTYTWLPPLVSTVVGVGLAAVGGFGIGALRPLGRWSELLLLPFAPWLFVAVGPLFLTKFTGALERGTLAGSGFVDLIPPVWLLVPGLFIFTFLFRGLAGQDRAAQERAGAAGPGFRAGRVILPALPMVALIAGATWLVQSQSLLWGLVRSFDRMTGPLWAYNQAAVGERDLGFGLVLPIPAILIFAVALGVLQVLYLDRIAIRVGRDRAGPTAPAARAGAGVPAFGGPPPPGYPGAAPTAYPAAPPGPPAPPPGPPPPGPPPPGPPPPAPPPGSDAGQA